MDLDDLTAQIEHALDVLRPIVHDIGDDDWDRPTACVDWAVREVLNHTVGGMRIFAAELSGQQPAADHESDWLGESRSRHSRPRPPSTPPHGVAA